MMVIDRVLYMIGKEFLDVIFGKMAIPTEILDQLKATGEEVREAA